VLALTAAHAAFGGLKRRLTFAGDWLPLAGTFRFLKADALFSQLSEIGNQLESRVMLGIPWFRAVAVIV
jgi:hypothetical protein